MQRVALASVSIVLMMTSSLQCARSASQHFQSLMNDFSMAELSLASRNLEDVVVEQSRRFESCVARHGAACQESIELAVEAEQQRVVYIASLNQAALEAMSLRIAQCQATCPNSSAGASMTISLPAASADPQAEYAAMLSERQSNLSQHALAATTAASLTFSQVVETVQQCTMLQGNCAFGPSFLDQYKLAITEAISVHDYNVQTATSYASRAQSSLDVAYSYIEAISAVQADLAAIGIQIGSPPVRPLSLPLGLSDFPNVPSYTTVSSSLQAPLAAWANARQQSTIEDLNALRADVDSGYPSPPSMEQMATMAPLAPYTAPYQQLAQVNISLASTSSLPGVLQGANGQQWSLSDPLQPLERLARVLDDMTAVLVNIDIAARVLHAVRILARCWFPTRLDLSPLVVDRPSPVLLLLRVPAWLPPVVVFTVAYAMAVEAYAVILNGFCMSCLASGAQGSLAGADLTAMAWQWAFRPGQAASDESAANSTRLANAWCAQYSGNVSATRAAQLTLLQSILAQGQAALEVECNCTQSEPTSLPNNVDFDCSLLLQGCADASPCVGPQQLVINASAAQTGCVAEGLVHSYVLGAMLSTVIYLCLNAARMALDYSLLNATYNARLRDRGSRPIVVEWKQGSVVGGAAANDVDLAVRLKDSKVRRMAAAGAFAGLSLNVTWLLAGQAVAGMIMVGRGA